MGSIDTIYNTTSTQGRPNTVPGPISFTLTWKRLWQRYLNWRAFQQSRAQLGKLSDYQLADIGVSRREAMAEAEKAKLWL